jgi:hypothetical protein
MVDIIIRDEILDQHHNPSQFALVKALLHVTQAGANSGLTPAEVLECVALTFAHISDVTSLRRVGAELLRSWAHHLENETSPVMEHIEGHA